MSRYLRQKMDIRYAMKQGNNKGNTVNLPRIGNMTKWLTFAPWAGDDLVKHVVIELPAPMPFDMVEKFIIKGYLDSVEDGS